MRKSKASGRRKEKAKRKRRGRGKREKERVWLVDGERGREGGLTRTTAGAAALKHARSQQRRGGPEAGDRGESLR